VGKLEVHFGGHIAKNHQVSMRTLGKTLDHLQNAIDRACLEKYHGVLWKYARMPQDLYAEAELLVVSPREGGYILGFLAGKTFSKGLLDRVSAAIKGAVEQSKSTGLKKSENIAEALLKRKQQVEMGIFTPKDLQDIFDKPDKAIVRRYADRAIVREVDQVLSIIRSDYAEDSTIEISLSDQTSAKYGFNRTSAQNFHSVITRKQLGEPILYRGRIMSMDRKNLSGKFQNAVTDKGSRLRFSNEDSFQEVISFFDKNIIFTFIGCPYIEYGAFDPNAGDIYYVGLKA